MPEPQERDADSNDGASSQVLARRLADYGWNIEPTDSGGVRMRTHRVLRIGVLCVSIVLLLILGLFAWLMYGLFSRMGEPPDEGFSGIFPTLLLVTLLGGIGVPFVGILAHVVWLLFAREEWEVSHNSIAVRRRLLGFRWGATYQDGKLVIEPHYTGGESGFWRLAVKSGGRKNYLIQERAISERGTGIAFESTREESEALAQLLGQYTGWPIITAQEEAEEAVRSAPQPETLPVALIEHGFRIGVDERLRLEVSRPQRSQIGCGIVALLIGNIWLCVVGAGLHSFSEHVGGVQEVVKDWPFLLLITPMLIGGVLIVLLGCVVIFSRERWSIDRNLFVVRSRLFGWTRETQYVAGVINLARVSTKINERTRWTWEVRLEDRTGRLLKKNLYNARDDDIPRQLAVVLSDRTGWPLREAES